VVAGIKWSADKELSHSVTIFSYTVNLVTQSVVAWLVLSLVNCCSQSPSCKARGAASSGRSPTGERGEEKTLPSVRPSPFFNTSVQHACYSSINVMLEMPFTVVFTVSSSVQSIPNAVRAQGPVQPPNSPYSSVRHQSTVQFYTYFTSLGGWLGSRVVCVQDSGAEGPGYKSQPRRFLVTVLGKLFTPICSPSSEIGSSPVKGCEGNCRPGKK